MLPQALRGELQEFRNRLKIPVSVGDIDVAKVCRELRQFPPNIQASAIPFDQLTCRETMTKILESRPRPTR
jgi:hypothetical protein